MTVNQQLRKELKLIKQSVEAIKTDNPAKEPSKIELIINNILKENTRESILLRVKLTRLAFKLDKEEDNEYYSLINEIDDIINSYAVEGGIL
jgi:hypothetical protein